MKLLLQRGADPLISTAGDLLPHHYAAAQGHDVGFTLLLEQVGVTAHLEDSQHENALHKTARGGHESIGELLLPDKNVGVLAQPNRSGWVPLTLAIWEGKRGVAEILLKNISIDCNIVTLTYDQSALYLAVGRGLEMVKLLLERDDLKIDMQNSNGETALYRAIDFNYDPESSLPRLLLAKNADPNIADNVGRTPLSCAAAKGYEAALELLLQQPFIAVEKADHWDQTPLLRAAERGKVSCVKLLLSHGGNVKHTDQKGRTALSLAAAQGEKIVAKVLLKHGADIDVQDQQGSTPLALATVGKHKPW